MTYARKGTLAVGAIVAAHVVVIAGAAFMVFSSSPTPSTVPATASHAAPAPDEPGRLEIATTAKPAAAPAKGVPAGKAADERRAALAFLSDIAKGNYSAAHDRFSEQARATTTVKKLERLAKPLHTARLKQVKWTDVRPDPELTTLVGVASTAEGQMDIELRLVQDGAEWKVKYLRFVKRDAPLRTASR